MLDGNNLPVNDEMESHAPIASEKANQDVTGFQMVGSRNRDMFFQMMNEWLI